MIHFDALSKQVNTLTRNNIEFVSLQSVWQTGDLISSTLSLCKGWWDELAAISHRHCRRRHVCHIFRCWTNGKQLMKTWKNILAKHKLDENVKAQFVMRTNGDGQWACVWMWQYDVCVYILLMFHGHKCILLCSFGYIKTENEIVSACSDVRLHNWRLIICYFDVRMHFRLIIFPPKYHNFRRFTTIRRQ